MTRKKRREPKVIAVDSSYIDPLGCDSTISYKVILGSRRLYGTVQLADCNRKIEWYFDNDRKALPKIDAAITMMAKFRAAFAAAMKESRQPRKKRLPHKNA